jgi:thiol:disulfide interchange protein DsbD
MQRASCGWIVYRARFVILPLLTFATGALGQLTPPDKSKKALYPASSSARITPTTAKPGDTVKLEVTVKLDPGYHTYDIEQPDLKAFATKIMLESTGRLKPSGRWSGTKPEEKNDEILGGRIRLHETSPTWSQELRVPADASAGRQAVAGKIRFQVCDDKTCLPPRDDKFEVTLEIKTAAGGAASTKTLEFPSEPKPKPDAKKPAGSKRAATRPKPDHRAAFAFWAEPAKIVPGRAFNLHVQAQVDEHWHIYSTTMKRSQIGPRPTVITITETAGLKPLGEFHSDKPPTKAHDSVLEIDTEYHDGDVTWTQVVKVPEGVKPGKCMLKGHIEHQLCDARQCLQPLKVPFEVTVEVSPDGSPGVPEPVASAGPPPETRATTPNGNGKPNVSTQPPAPAGRAASVPGTRGSLGGFLVVALGTGFGSILTPCVFPMIPITVGFFLKQSQARRTSPLMMATIYSLTIVGVFTGLGVLLGRLFVVLGGHWAFNLGMAAVLGILGLALMGVFELRMPAFLVQFTSSREGQGGLLGVMFMALTFVVVSTPCTGPFVGQVLVWSSQGEWTWPILGLITYSAALASPFFVLALVPGLLGTLPKGGGWLNTFKTTVGFVVLATTFYFLVKADLGLQTGLVTRSFVLAAWAAMGLAAGLYLAGLVRLAHDGPGGGISVGRLQFAVVFLAVGLYFTSGLFGQQLNSWIEAMLPHDESRIARPDTSEGGEPVAWVDNSFDQAIERARAENRPLFVDFTGQRCVNCWAMERGVFPRPAVVERFRQMVLVKLYTDRLTPADNANQRLLEERFNTVGVPYYVVLSPDGRTLGALGGRDSEQGFVAFLDKSLDQWASSQSPPDSLAAGPAGTENASASTRPLLDRLVDYVAALPDTAGNGATSQPNESPGGSPNASDKFWQPFDLARATRLLRDGHNLVVDWTADW